MIIFDARFSRILRPIILGTIGSKQTSNKNLGVYKIGMQPTQKHVPRGVRQKSETENPIFKAHKFSCLQSGLSRFREGSHSM